MGQGFTGINIHVYTLFGMHKAIQLKYSLYSTLNLYIHAIYTEDTEIIEQYMNYV